MPLDFRYHLASLAAAFFALLIGTLLGVAMKGGPGLSEQIQQLRAEFKRSEALQDIDRRTDEFNERTQLHLIRGRLMGRNIALVRNPGGFPDEEADAVRSTLEQAGATVAFDIKLRQALLQVTPEQVVALYRQLGLEAPGQPRVEPVLEKLALDIGIGRTEIAAILAKEKLIRVRGDTSTPVSSVVLLGGIPATLENPILRVDSPFLRGCQERQLRVAAVEPFTNPRSAMRAYQKVVPITVDNADHAAGRIALVLALATGQAGHYGYKSTANEVVPDIE